MLYHAPPLLEPSILSGVDKMQFEQVLGATYFGLRCYESSAEKLQREDGGDTLVFSLIYLTTNTCPIVIFIIYIYTID
jgi:hypothetical protein